MTVTVRFAPSPTGLLHVGNARIALLNSLYATVAGGQLVLRLDDTDSERCEDKYTVAIEEDLNWLGINWQYKIRQSERRSLYDSAFAKLAETGRVYPCYDTVDDLTRHRQIQRRNKQPPLYDNTTALKLTEKDCTRLKEEGKQPYWRFHLNVCDVQWLDLIRGHCHYNSAHLSDPVLRRTDGTYLYTLPSVVDDINLAITHVIRGEDHITNTVTQIQIFHALKAQRLPVFGHVALISDINGRNLSKRLGSLSLSYLRNLGVEPMALANLLVAVDTASFTQPKLTLTEFTKNLDSDQFFQHIATPRFNESDLWHTNARLLHEMPFSTVRERFVGMGLDEVTEGFWNAVRANLDRFDTATTWWQICTDHLVPTIIDKDFCNHAADLLPLEPWDEMTWFTWTNAIRSTTGRSGKTLFRPLRLALTNRDDGPDLSGLLPIIGHERAFSRLKGG